MADEDDDLLDEMMADGIDDDYGNASQESPEPSAEAATEEPKKKPSAKGKASLTNAGNVRTKNWNSKGTTRAVYRLQRLEFLYFVKGITDANRLARILDSTPKTIYHDIKKIRDIAESKIGSIASDSKIQAIYRLAEEIKQAQKAYKDSQIEGTLVYKFQERIDQETGEISYARVPEKQIVNKAGDPKFLQLAAQLQEKLLILCGVVVPRILDTEQLKEPTPRVILHSIDDDIMNLPPDSLEEQANKYEEILRAAGYKITGDGVQLPSSHDRNSKPEDTNSKGADEPTGLRESSAPQLEG